MKKSTKILWILLAFTLLLLLPARMAIGQQNSGSTGQLYEIALYTEEVKGDLSAAVELYLQVLEENPNDRQLAAQTLLHLGLCYEKLGSDQARQAYRDVISKYSEQAEEVSLARERMDLLEAYVADLNEKAKKHMKQGNELFKLWEYESAVKEYENAISLRPNTQLALNAQYCIGQTWYRAGNYDEALSTLTKLMEEHPQSTITPVTELMVSQVQYAMVNNENQASSKIDYDENTIIDPKTGITYNKIKTFEGKNDLISYLSGGANMSPDCRFMNFENKVIPMDGGDPFNLVDMDALRGIYAPDMKNAAFLADSAIWTVPVSSETGRSIGAPLKLLEGRYRFQTPVNWSPNGKQIAFTRDEKDLDLDIWTVNIADGGLSRITSSTEIEHSPCWSPNGKSIAYKKGSELWLASISGSENDMLLKNGGKPRRWSPDNKWLYHSNWENNHFYSLDLLENYEINFPVQAGKFVSFSPEGKKLLFYRSSYDDKWPLKIVSASGGASYKPAGNETAYGSIWLGDSKHMMVQDEDEQEKVIMKIISLAGGDPLIINIEADVDGEVFPFDLLPGLTQIALSVKRENGKKDLYVAPFSVQEARITGPARKIFSGWSGRAYNATTSWSADGKKLALSHDGDIWVIPLDGGNPVQITKTVAEERWLDWSPDGKWISYKIFNQSEKTETLYVIQPEKEIPRIVHPDCHVESIWNYNSESIIIFTGKELQVISLDGEILEHILNIKDLGLEMSGFHSLSPDGKHIAFVGYKSGDKSVIIKYSFDSKKITLLGDDNLLDSKYWLNWSSDGKWLSYLTYEEIKVRPEGSLWEVDFEEVKQKLLSRE